MKDYTPLRLGRRCNVGPEVFKQVHKPDELPRGAAQLHGLPFVMGGPRSRACYAGFGKRPRFARKPVTITVNKAARHVIIAHTILEPRPGHHPVGGAVAEYRFRLGGGEEIAVPIRERFEIGSFPMGWGQYPFLARADQKDGLFARHEGKWGDAGIRQTETYQGWPKPFFLWVWTNPKPQHKLAAITIVPTETPIVIGGITLSHLDEFPINRQAMRTVKITLPKKADAEKPFALEVEVDRGLASYAYPLPAAGADAFVDDPFHGWGEAQNDKSSPAYVELAGTPSATITVKQQGRPIGKANWGALQRRGKLAASARVRLEVIDNGRNWVHTTVVDDATGKPVPCRIHFRSPAGVPYAPHGHHAHVNSNNGTWHLDIGGDVRLGQISYAYIDGTCQGWLPAGEVIVDVCRGYEYEPLRRRVTIQPGQRELTLRLKRWIDMNGERLFSGDTHVHFVSTQGGHTEARGEGVNVVNLLQSQWGHLFTNTEEFVGRPSVSHDGESIVYCSQENRQHMLGHLSLLGLKKPVMPWCSDGPGEAELGANIETTLSHWADRCHEQGGLVVIPHVPVPNCEPATLIATGRADAVEMLQYNPYFHEEYYKYLNAGYRLPLVGGTDKMTSDVPIGIYRTYAYIPPDQEFNYENWCNAVRAGRTFMTGGPMLWFTVEGRHVGSTLSLPGNGGTVTVQARAESILPIHSLQIVQQGRVVASTEDRAGARSLRLEAKIDVTGHTWLAARCAGPDYTAVLHHDSWRRGVMAHTSPVYVECGGAYDVFDAAVAQYVLTLCEGGLSYLRTLARQHDGVPVTHHHHEADHQAYLESPFREAIAAIHRRMHQHGIPH